MRNKKIKFNLVILITVLLGCIGCMALTQRTQLLGEECCIVEFADSCISGELLYAHFERYEMNVSSRMYAQKEISIERNLYEVETAFDPALDVSG